MKFLKYPFLLLFLISCQGVPPSDLGIKGEKGNTFLPCPSSPNCVSSTLEKEDPHYIDPIIHNVSNELAKKRIIKALDELGNCKISKIETDYLWAECSSALFKFVDDLEVYFQEGKIQLKSASRKGHSDLGVNKKRVNEISFKFHQSAIR